MIIIRKVKPPLFLPDTLVHQSKYLGFLRLVEKSLKIRVVKSFRLLFIVQVLKPRSTRLNFVIYGIYKKSKGVLSWPFLCPSWNKLIHILYGNRKLGYNIGFWNCRKGLINSNYEASEKLTDIKSLLYGQQLDLLGLVECDPHSKTSCNEMQS